MAYATKADLVPEHLTNEELIQLTDDNNGGVVNDEIVTAKLDKASAMVDSYCRARYAVPLASSVQVKSLTLAIATYELFLRRRRIPEEIGAAYDNAIAFLKDVAANKAGLDQPTAAAPQVSAGGPTTTTKEDKFSDTNLAGFVS